MYLDKYLLLSDAQAITGSSNSENTIDTLAAGSAVEANPILHLLVDTAFDGTAGSSVQFILQTSSDNSTWVNLDSITKSIADLTAGAVINMQLPPTGLLRYIRAYYTVTGTVSAGAVTAFLAKDVDVTMDKAL